MKKNTSKLGILKIYLLLILFLGYITSIFSAQKNENIFIDFGVNFQIQNLTFGNWNNINLNYKVKLINSRGDTTNYIYSVINPYSSGSTSGPDNTTLSASIFPPSVTRDAYYSTAKDFSSFKANPLSSFQIAGLDTSRYYSFSIFGSRNNVTDIREVKYTVIGNKEKYSLLNTSNNTTKTADINYMKPNSKGIIQINAESGPNNNSQYGFYYLNGLKISSCEDTTIIENKNNKFLKLTAPRIFPSKWFENDIERIEWYSDNIDSLNIEIGNEQKWNRIARVKANIGSYNYQITNLIGDYRIRLTSDTLQSVSQDVVQFYPQTKKSVKIVILGSSTAQGIGVSSYKESWAFLYNDYLHFLDSRISITNLAVAGFTTYYVLPNGSTLPSNITYKVDTLHNITAALNLHPDLIIINLPSNDTSSGYSADTQISNYKSIKMEADKTKTPLFFCSPQPNYYNQSGNSTQLSVFKMMIDSFGINNVIDYWNPLVDTNTNHLKDIYDSGDHTHPNFLGHNALFQSILKSKTTNFIMNLLDTITNIENINSYNNFYVVSTNSNELVCNFNLVNDQEKINLEILNTTGQIINQININNPTKGLNSCKILFNRLLNKGIYICNIKSNKSIRTCKFYIK